MDSDEKQIEEKGGVQPITAGPAAGTGKKASPAKKRVFWSHPWFIMGAIVFTVAVVFTLMNDRPVTVSLLGSRVEKELPLPLLMLICALIGAAIEFFTSLGPRLHAAAENKLLRKKVAELEQRAVVSAPRLDTLDRGAKQ